MIYPTYHQIQIATIALVLLWLLLVTAMWYVYGGAL